MTTIDSSDQPYTGIDDLSVELVDGVLSVTMNRPDSLNSLTAAMLDAIADTLERAATDPRVRWCDSAAPGAASAPGAGSAKRTRPQKAVDGPASVIDAANRAVRSIVNLPTAGGRRRAGAVRRCRRVAGVGVRCRTGLGEGVFHAGVHQDRADARRRRVGVDRRAVGRIRAMRMALLAERITAAEAYEWGLVTAVLPGRRVRRRGGQGDLDAGVRSRRGAAQDQAGHQRRDAHRTRGRARARDARASWCCWTRTTSARAPGRSSSARANFTDSYHATSVSVPPDSGVRDSARVATLAARRKSLDSAQPVGDHRWREYAIRDSNSRWATPAVGACSHRFGPASTAC